MASFSDQPSRVRLPRGRIGELVKSQKSRGATALNGFPGLKQVAFKGVTSPTLNRSGYSVGFQQPDEGYEGFPLWYYRP
jgi:hypothetical protein